MKLRCIAVIIFCAPLISYTIIFCSIAFQPCHIPHRIRNICPNLWHFVIQFKRLRFDCRLTFFLVHFAGVVSVEMYPFGDIELILSCCPLGKRPWIVSEWESPLINYEVGEARYRCHRKRICEWINFLSHLVYSITPYNGSLEWRQ